MKLGGHLGSEMIARSVIWCIVAIFVGGCAWQEPKQGAMPWHSSEAQAVVDMPAAKVVETVEKAVTAPPLSLQVETTRDGTVITGWKEYPGDIHIVRRWHERTKFRISVMPDFSNPSGRSKLMVEDQTQERAIDTQPWYNAPNTSRPDRAKSVLSQIEQHLLAH